MRWSVVKAVLRRELVDVLMDRRTLFATFVLPVVLYPALTVGFGALAAKEKASLEKREARVIVRLVGDAAGLPRSEHPLVAELAKRPQLVLSDEPDVAAAVRDGRGVMVDWRYVDGSEVLPPPEVAKGLRPPG